MSPLGPCRVAGAERARRPELPARSTSPQRLAHPQGLRAGASRPVLFRDGRGFHEFPLLPGEHGAVAAQPGGPGRAGRAGSALPLPGLTTSGTHCRQPPPPQLSGPRDRPGPHWRALPPQEKASGGGDAQTHPVSCALRGLSLPLCRVGFTLGSRGVPAPPWAFTFGPHTLGLGVPASTREAHSGRRGRQHEC